MTSQIWWRDPGPDVEMIRLQLAANPPDDGSFQLEQEDGYVTKATWTSNGRACSVSASLRTKRPNA
jgi:hypothetical protein